MSRIPFSFKDVEQECHIHEAAHQLDGQPLGIAIHVPAELYCHYPFNASAYAFMQQLRSQILEFGTIEFPGLPVNKTNYTLAQRAPKEHLYSSNPYLTDICQFPHQDTPPYPTAFWLGERRQFFATWVISNEGLINFQTFSQNHPHLAIDELHRHLVNPSICNGTGILLNQQAGLLLIDNSHHRQLYHARTCLFDAVNKHPDYDCDTPMYAFNEQGLLHYIDMLDSRRGDEARDPQDKLEMLDFIQIEGSL